MKSTPILYCQFEPHLYCNPSKCSLLKCPKVQKELGMPIERLYELGLKDRPKQDLPNQPTN